MTVKQRAQRILASAEYDLLAAKKRRDDIEEAMEMLANSDIPDAVLNDISPELEEAKEDVRDALVKRMLIRCAMIKHDWLDD